MRTLLIRHFVVFSTIPFLLLLRLTISAHSPGFNKPHKIPISSLLIFGDSTVDSGNNNYVPTLFKSNFPPYGRSFPSGLATGRFTDGRLVTDYIASYVGLKENVPPYLDRRLSTEELMTGVSFASAGSGFDPLTPKLSGVIPMEKQIEYFKEYKAKLEGYLGKEGAKMHISKAVFLVSAGTNDFVITYYGTPFRRKTHDVNAYQEFLLQHTRQFIQSLREEGAQLIAVVSLPPMGCLPIVITTTDIVGRRRQCSDAISAVALDYNRKLQSTLASLQNSNSTLIYGDIYKPFNDLIQNTSRLGFDVGNRGCCGSGLLEASLLCNAALPVCANPNKYVFFDSVHPTQASYEYLFNSLRPMIDLALKNYRL